VASTARVRYTTMPQALALNALKLLHCCFKSERVSSVPMQKLKWYLLFIVFAEISQIIKVLNPHVSLGDIFAFESARMIANDMKIANVKDANQWDAKMPLVLFLCLMSLIRLMAAYDLRNKTLFQLLILSHIMEAAFFIPSIFILGGAPCSLEFFKSPSFGMQYCFSFWALMKCAQNVTCHHFASLYFNQLQ